MDEDIIWASLFLGLGSLLFVMSVLFLVYVYQLVRYLKERHANPFQTISDIFSSVYDVLEEEPQLICGLMWRWCQMKARYGTGFDDVEEVTPFRFRNFVLGIGSIVALMVAANVMAFLAYNEVKDLTWILVVAGESLINMLSLCIIYPWRFVAETADKFSLDACFCYNRSMHDTKWSCCCLTCQPKNCCFCWCLFPNCFSGLHWFGSFAFLVVNPGLNMILNVIKYVHRGRSVTLISAYVVLTCAYGVVMLLFVFYCKKPEPEDTLTVLTNEVLSEREKAFWTKFIELKQSERESRNPMQASSQNPDNVSEGKEGNKVEDDRLLQSMEMGRVSEVNVAAATGDVQPGISESPNDSKTPTGPTAATPSPALKWPKVCGVSINLVYLELVCICLIIATNMTDLVVQFFEVD